MIGKIFTANRPSSNGNYPQYQLVAKEGETVIVKRLDTKGQGLKTLDLSYFAHNYCEAMPARIEADPEFTPVDFDVPEPKRTEPKTFDGIAMKLNPTLDNNLSFIGRKEVPQKGDIIVKDGECFKVLNEIWARDNRWRVAVRHEESKITDWEDYQVWQDL